MARDATRYYANVEPEDMRFVLVEAADRILPEVGADMGKYTVEQLRKRGIEVKLETRLESCVDGHVVLSDGNEFDADTIVWTAGVKANPVLSATRTAARRAGPDPVPGRTCGSSGVDDVWAAGDNAAVPDLSVERARGDVLARPRSTPCARRKVLAENIVADRAATRCSDYAHKHVGSVAGLGLDKGVAKVYGMKLKGWPAWFMHRTYHLSPGPHVQPQGPGLHRLDARAVLPPRGPCLGQPADPVRRVPPRDAVLTCDRAGAVPQPVGAAPSRTTIRPPCVMYGSRPPPSRRETIRQV